MGRAVGVIRQSRQPRRSRLAQEPGNSPAEQRAKIEGWAKLHGHEVVGWATDLDVSGHSVRPFDRPELSKWLARPESYDILVASKLDRISRNVRDFSELTSWAQADGRDITIACVAESFDLSAPMGRMVASMLSIFAEFEWEQIRSRRLGAVETLRAKGLWKGGNTPYGHRPEEVSGGYRMVQDEETAPVARRMALLAIEGTTMKAWPGC